MKPVFKMAASAVGLGLLMAGCVDDPENAGKDHELAGNWQVSAINGAAIPGVSVTMDMADGKVSGSSGCNRYNTGYTLSGSTLTFADAAMTRMACAPAEMDAEARFGKALNSVTSFSFSSEGELQMYSGSSLVLLATRS